MPILIEGPTPIQSVGIKSKQIQEYIGHINSGHSGISVAHMISPEGWEEPRQRTEFEEFTVVLRGLLRVDYQTGRLDVQEGQAVVANAGEWIRYSTPEPGGAGYIAICVPAFSPDTVNRDE